MLIIVNSGIINRIFAGVVASVSKGPVGHGLLLYSAPWIVNEEMSRMSRLMNPHIHGIHVFIS